MDEITIEDFFKVDLRIAKVVEVSEIEDCLLYTSPSPRDVEESRMPSSA